VTVRENLEAALNGETPETTPYSFYSWMVWGMKGLGVEDTRAPEALFAEPLRRLYDRGLGMCHHVHSVAVVEHGVENSTEHTTENGIEYTVFTKKTPVGTVRKINRGSWHYRDWIEEPADYLVWKWIVDNSELVTRYDEFEAEVERIGDAGVCVALASRTPALAINVDLAGVMRFCTDLATGVEEFHALYESLEKRFLEETRLVASGPGRFVKWLENLTAPVYGPRYYEEYVSSVYRKAVPMLEAAGKRVMVHYDGQLDCIRDEIAQAPVHIIESLSEAPEGDLPYDECRRIWPEKAFWGNLNVGLYQEEPAVLARAVEEKIARAGTRGFALEISEQMPANWQDVIPVVLDAIAHH